MSVYRVYEDVGADGYPPEWHRLPSAHGTWPGIKHIVREAAGHRCIRCGHPYSKGEGEWSRCDDRCSHGGPMRVVDSEGVVKVRHANGPPDFQAHIFLNTSGWAREAAWRILTVHHLNGVKADCRWWNLVSLCQRCHLRVQRVVVMPRVWPWPHSDWFKPYVAGYYASVYLGEELERDEVEARLDELLALEAAA